MLRPVTVLQSVLSCEEHLLRGILVLCQNEFGGERGTSGSGRLRHFPGRLTKAGLLDLHKEKTK